MIGYDLGQIRRFRLLGNNRCRVRNMLKQRAVREKRTARYKNYSCVRPSIAGEVCRRDGAAIFQHYIQNKHVRCLSAKNINGLGLTGNHFDRVVLSF